METKKKQFFVPPEACALSGSRVGVMEGPALLANNEKKLVLCLLTYRWQLQAWASEGFFPGGLVGDFPKFISRGGSKVVKFGFHPSKLKKQPFFANNFKIQGWPSPPLPTPMATGISR